MTALAIATFAEEGPYLRARVAAVAAQRRIVGEWLPYASEALGEGEGERGIRAAAIIVGVLGAVGLFALTTWSMMIAYPLNVGGRPLWSWPAFIPAPVEFGALAAAIGGVTVLFRNARLTRLHHSAFEWDEIARASQDAFVLAITCDAGDDANRVLALMANAGATHSRLVGA